MSIVRVGLAETKNFAEGYEAIFGKKEEAAEAKPEETTAKAGSDEKKQPEKK
jgi:hypothetical protein